MFSLSEKIFFFSTWIVFGYRIVEQIGSIWPNFKNIKILYLSLIVWRGVHIFRRFSNNVFSVII